MKTIPLAAACTIATLSLLLAAAPADAQALLDITFEGDDVAQHFDPLVNGALLGPVRGALTINSQVDRQTLKPVPVQPLGKYKLTVRAAANNSDTVETNDRIAEILERSGGRSFAACELEFLDADGKPTSFLLYGRVKIETQGLALVSGDFHDFVTVFYAPPAAASLRLVLESRKERLFLERLVLEQETEEGAVNGNPDFRYGEYNLAGWEPDPEGRLYKRPDGKTVLKCGLYGRSSFFPVDDSSRYSFLCHGVGYDTKDGKVTVSFYDEAGNELGNTHLFWGKDMATGAVKSGIQPPPGARLALLKASRVILEKVVVTQDDPAAGAPEE
ncbi:hypothetical protein [Lignipirellula cremea]|uniref:Uncharacterized protein n=1 Tax=Lignipirellula cremea TaxID=2528010 RepID=A0A518DNP2_9BACT|nr:hypothetical protein [Lignipirellula cremea]QDU93451.1 hypothetical protein Pla8534_12310 [Lignipirellula cremea]